MHIASCMKIASLQPAPHKSPNCSYFKRSAARMTLKPIRCKASHLPIGLSHPSACVKGRRSTHHGKEREREREIDSPVPVQSKQAKPTSTLLYANPTHSPSHPLSPTLRTPPAQNHLIAPDTRKPNPSLRFDPLQDSKANHWMNTETQPLQ